MFLLVDTFTALLFITCMAHLVKVSKLGQHFERGKVLSADLRRSVIDKILRNGGNRATGEFDGSLKDIGHRFNIYGNTLRNIRECFCTEYDEQPRPKPAEIHLI